MKETHPTRPITDPRFKWVGSAHTDIRKTFEKFKRLERLRQAAQQKGTT